MLLSAGEGRDHSRGQQAGSRRLGGSIERRRVPPTDSPDALLNRRGKDAFSLEAQNRAPTLPHHGDDYLEFHQGLHWTAKTIEQFPTVCSKPAPENGLQ